MKAYGQTTLTVVNDGEKGDPGTPAINVVIGNESQNIPCDKTGCVNGNILITIPFAGYYGIQREACNVSVGVLPSGITVGSITNATNKSDGKIILNVANKSNLGNTSLMSGNIILTFTIKEQTITKNFTWTKSIAGQDASFYTLDVSTVILLKNTDQELTPNSITLNAYINTGNASSPSPYSGRFIIKESENGTTFSTKYSSSSNESTKTYVPSNSNLKYILCELYQAGSLTNKLDSQTVTVLLENSELLPEITEIKNSVEQVELKVDKNTQAISQKASRNDITELINNYDNTTVKTIRDQVAEQTTSIGEIESTVSDIQSVVETKADGTVVQTLSEKIAKVEQDADGFKQTVEENYVSNDKLNQNNQTLRSEFSQTAETIKQSVSDLEGNVSDMQQDITGIHTSIKDANGNIAKIEQTASELSTKVQDNAGNITKLQQTSQSIQQDITNIEGDVSSIQQTVNGISTKVETVEGDVSSLKQTAESMQSQIEDNAGNISKLEQDSNSFKVSVSQTYSTKKESIKSSIDEFYLSSSPTSLSGGSWSTSQPTWTDGKYIWSRSKVIYANGDTTYSPSQNGVCITGNTGAKGANGTSVTIREAYIYYQSGTSGTTPPTGEWLSTIPSVAAGNYLWTKTVVNYSDGNSTTAYGVSKIGTNGSNGSSVTIKSTSVTYQKSSSGTTAPTGSWSTSIPTVNAGEFLWTKTLVTYSDGKSTTSYSVSRNGTNGATGNGIQSITNYYLASASSADITTGTSGWTTTIQSITSSKRYLWNYEKVTYTNGSITTTIPCIIGVYGSTGATGATGNGISGITEYYQVSTSNSTEPTSWQTTVPTLTATNKYLWNYEKISYTNGTSKDTLKRVIGVYGDKGATGNTGAAGNGVKSSTVTYQSSTSGTTVPTGTWSSSIPSVAAGSYLWTRTVITYTNGSSTTSYSVGKMGSTGATGSAGKGVKSTAVTYQAGSSQTSAPSGSWGTSVPKLTTTLPYLWTRTIITYTDNSTSTSYSVSSTLDSFEVGGRNLMKNSKSPKVWYCSYGSSTTGSVTSGVEVEEYVAGILVNTAYRINQKAGQTGDYRFSCVPDSSSDVNTTILPADINGNTYTFCVWMKSNVDTSVTMFLTNRNDGDGGSTVTPLYANKWAQVFVTRKFTSAPTSPGLRARLSFSSKDANIIVGLAKLEKGSKPTDWTPAPEDMATSEEVKNAQSSADEAYGLASSNESALADAKAELEVLSDSISTLVTDSDGNSMMTQTSNGWTFNISAITKSIEDAKDTLEHQGSTINGMNTTISNLDKLVDDITEKTAYIIMATDDKGLPCIELGKQNNPFKLRITNESIDFMQDGVRIAYITNRQLYIQSSVVTDEMKIGAGSGFIWKKRSNGNMGLRWVNE